MIDVVPSPAIVKSPSPLIRVGIDKISLAPSAPNLVSPVTFTMPLAVPVPPLATRAPFDPAAPWPITNRLFDTFTPPLICKVPPEFTVALLEPRALLFAVTSVPPLMVVPPV